MKLSLISPFLAASMLTITASFTLTLFAPLAAATDNFEGYSIETIAKCEPNLDEAKGNTLVLFNGHKNVLSGWSHVKNSAEFKGLNLPLERYGIATSNSQADKSCGGANTYQAVLVKKYADWDRQHANGIEPHFLSDAIKFGQVDQIVLEVKLNSATSTTPTPAKIKAVYGNHVKGDDALDAWDAGKANFSITLFEQGWEEQDNPSFTAARFIEIDQAKYADHVRDWRTHPGLN